MARSKRPAGTPTPTNLFTLAQWYADGMPARVRPTFLPHLRRCLAAGLIEQSGGVPKITEAGLREVERLGASRKRATSVSSPGPGCDYCGVRGERLEQRKHFPYGGPIYRDPETGERCSADALGAVRVDRPWLCDECSVPA